MPDIELIHGEACPSCATTIPPFPATLTSIKCAACGGEFDLVAEPTTAAIREALGADAPPPPPPPPPPLAVPGPAAPPPPPASDDDDGDPGLDGAGDAATPDEAARKRTGRRAPEAPRVPGTTDFMYRTREYRWVALGGKGNPYGPTSVSSVIFEVVREAGEAGIDPVDVALEVRRRLQARGEDCQSILQRVTMVTERVCVQPTIRIMERVNQQGVLDPKGLRVRVTAEHRVEVPVPATGMVGKRRAARLQAAR